MKPTISQRAVVMVRTGRKRKPGKRYPNDKRYPNGELVNEHKEREAMLIVASRMPHRQEAPAGLRHDPKALTSLGRLNQKGIITDTQYDAGNEWSRRVALYRASIGCPRVGESIAGIFQPSKGGPISFDAAHEIKEKYDEAFEVLDGLRKPKKMPLKTVNRIAIWDQECAPWLFEHLTYGLDALVAMLAKRRKRA